MSLVTSSGPAHSVQLCHKGMEFLNGQTLTEFEGILTEIIVYDLLQFPDVA